MAELEYTHEDGIGTILLNRPERKNSFTLEMLDAWFAALAEARQDPDVRVLVVRGAGDAFCAGVDLRALLEDFGDGPEEQRDIIRNRVQRIPLALDDFEKPVIASISGPAVGAGLDMALMCDMRLAARSARLAESYVRVGLFPGAGGLYYLPRLVGLGKAFEIFMTGAFIDAEEAERLGIVNHVYDDDALVDETYAMAGKLAKIPPLIAGMIKRALYQSAQVDLRTALDLAASNLAVVRSTDVSKETMAAFREKEKVANR
jgi:enoyl-CoA hydratase/carnithine racemase